MIYINICQGHPSVYTGERGVGHNTKSTQIRHQKEQNSNQRENIFISQDSLKVAVLQKKKFGEKQMSMDLFDFSLEGNARKEVTIMHDVKVSDGFKRPSKEGW